MMVPYGIIRTVGLVTVLGAVFVQCSNEKIHERMTDAEIANVFHTTRQNIPEYEVILLKHNMRARGRAGRKLRLEFTAFGKKIDTYLNPSDGVLAGRNTPVWLASTKPDGTVEHKKMRNDIMGIVVGMYCTFTSTDSILVWQRDAQPVAFQGFIDELIIRSLPDRLKTSTRKRREFNFPESNETLVESYPHVVIKSKLPVQTLQTQIAGKIRSSDEADHSQSKRSTKDVIYPSILVSTDYSTEKTPENDLNFYDEIIYQLAFWNGVDLRFRSVSNPKIRIRIAGIIIALDREATPFFKDYRQGDMWVVFPQEVPEIRQYWADLSRQSEFSREAYDMVVTVTDNDMSVEYNDTRIQRVAGIGMTGSLCPRPNEDFNAVAVVSDRGGFRGITAAVHELGHMMGLTHDEDSNDDCDAFYEFIMAPSGNGPNNLRWSRCSLRRLSQLMRQDRINCVDEPANYHDPGTAVRIILPGTIRDADKQCKGRRYRVACMLENDICMNLKCAYEWEEQNTTSLCYDIGPAAEGTACSEGHVCVDGVCQCLTMACMYN